MIYERINWKNGEEGNTPINDVNLNKMDEAIAYLFENGVGGGGGGDNTPIGTIFAYGGETAPEGYLLANGQEVSRTEYVDLFNVYGTTYGEGNGSTTFNVPDYRDRVPVGLNVNTEYFNSLGKKGGEANHTLTIAEMPRHTHSDINVGGNHLTAWNDKTGNTSIINLESLSSGNGVANQNYMDTGANGGNQPHNNLQPYIVTNFIIKATKATPTQAEVEDSLESNSTTNAPSIHAVNEALNGTVLYENADGSKETITLNDNASNYKYVEVYYRNSDYIRDTKKIEQNKVYNLKVDTIYAGDLYFKSRAIVLKENTIETYNNCYVSGYFHSGSSVSIETINNIYITKVVGYK